MRAFLIFEEYQIQFDVILVSWWTEAAAEVEAEAEMYNRLV